MANVTYRQPDGSESTLHTDKEVSVMYIAVTNEVPGIVAECGGNAMCATCHVYVPDEYLDRLPDMEEDEDEMLDGAAAPRTGRSRLSCQLKLTDDLDGLVVEIPETQL